MALHFVADDAAGAAPGGVLVLTGDEAHHAAAVRRVRPGETVTVGDGRGAWLTGECLRCDPRRVTVRVAERRDVAAPAPRIVLVQALAKGDRDERAVQSATELGVDAIVPWQAERSVSRWSDDPKAAKGRTRWQTIVREAAKQAHRAWVPTVEAVAPTGEVAVLAAASRLVVLEPAGDVRLSTLRFDPADDSDIVLVVGPEGGIAPRELEQLAGAGAAVAVLGETVLRTSTAGPAAIAVVSTLLGRW